MGTGMVRNIHSQMNLRTGVPEKLIVLHAKTSRLVGDSAELCLVCGRPGDPEHANDGRETNSLAFPS